MRPTYRTVIQSDVRVASSANGQGLGCHCSFSRQSARVNGSAGPGFAGGSGQQPRSSTAVRPKIRAFRVRARLAVGLVALCRYSRTTTIDSPCDRPRPWTKPPSVAPPIQTSASTRPLPCIGQEPFILCASWMESHTPFDCCGCAQRGRLSPDDSTLLEPMTDICPTKSTALSQLVSQKIDCFTVDAKDPSDWREFRLAVRSLDRWRNLALKQNT